MKDIKKYFDQFFKELKEQLKYIQRQSEVSFEQDKQEVNDKDKN